MWWRRPTGIRRVGETVAGNAVHYFPGGKGANQAVAAAKLGASTTLIGRLGTDAFGQQLRTFLAAQGVDLALVKDTAGIHSGTAIITIADADNTIVVVPGANALVSADDVAAPLLAKGDVAVSQFEIPLPTIGAFFKRARAAGATTILNPAPAIACGPELLELVDILVLNETELGLLAQTELHDTDEPARFIEAARRLPTGADRIICVTLGKRGVLALVGGEPLVDCRARREGGGHHRRRRLLRRRPRRPDSPMERRSATRSNTPMPPHRSACSGWAPRRRCRRRPRSRRFCVRSPDADFVGWANGGVPTITSTAWRWWARRKRAFAHPTKYQPRALFRSKLLSAACSGVIEPWAASRRRPNMWSPARLTDSMPTSCPAL